MVDGTEKQWTDKWDTVFLDGECDTNTLDGERDLQVGYHTVR